MTCPKSSVFSSKIKSDVQSQVCNKNGSRLKFSIKAIFLCKTRRVNKVRSFISE